MSFPTTVHLVRHGNVHNPQKVLYGRLPRFRLSGRGVEEARAAGRSLNGTRMDALYSSPLLRARQTAREILRFQPGLRLKQSRHLLEVLNAYEGRPGAEVDALHGDVYTGVGPPYEQPSDIVARMRVFFRAVRRRHPGGHIAAVTHGDVIVFSMLWARGLPLTPQSKSRLHALGFPGGYPSTGSLTTFIFKTGSESERPEVRYREP
jgi:broad specificity phosphatase PhoE